MKFGPNSECTRLRVNPDVNCGLQMIMFHVGSLIVTRVPLQRGFVGEAVPVWRQRAHGKSLFLPLNFAVKLKRP